MPIEKGEAWGAPGLLPAASPVASGDAALAALVGAHEIAAVSAGDIARTLGIRAPYDRAGEKHVAPLDAIEVVLDDGDRHRAIAHVVAGSLLRSGECVAIMNAAFLGKHNIAPRAHPGDGKADVVSLRLGPADRLKAWRRMPTGTHVPHPDIAITRKAAGTVELTRPHIVRVDGVAVGRASHIRYSIEPDAISIAI